MLCTSIYKSLVIFHLCTEKTEIETKHQNRYYFLKDNYHSSMEKETLKGHAVSKTGLMNCKMILKSVALIEVGVTYASPGFL